MRLEDRTAQNEDPTDQQPEDFTSAYSEHLSDKIKNRIMEFVEKLGRNFNDKDADKVNSDISSMNRGALAEVWDKVMFLLKRFNENSTPKEKALIIGVLLYAILPIDIIPDIIPGIGLIDDAFAIVMVYTIVKKSIPVIKKAVVKTQVKVVKRVDGVIGWAVEQKLDLIYSRKLVSSLFNLVIFIFAILFTTVPVLGNLGSSIIASILLLSSFVLAIISIVKTLRNRHTIPLIKSILRSRSLKKGVAEYIRNLDTRISFGEKTIDEFFTLLGESANQKFLDHLVDHCCVLLKKNVIRFCILILCVIISFFFVRYALLSQFSDLSFWEIVFRPFIMLANDLR